jgi:hypothetical protein
MRSPPGTTNRRRLVQRSCNLSLANGSTTCVHCGIRWKGPLLTGDNRYDATTPCFHKMPEYLEKTGYRNPTDPDDGVFQYTKGFRGDLFKYYQTHSREGQSFNNIMGGVMANQAGMLDIYPYDALNDSKPGGSAVPLLVDVGGNVGHDIEKFRARQPQAASRLVLQDLPDVVARAKCTPPVQVIAHDFFTPQPIQGQCPGQPTAL